MSNDQAPYRPYPPLLNRLTNRLTVVRGHAEIALKELRPQSPEFAYVAMVLTCVDAALRELSGGSGDIRVRTHDELARPFPGC